MFGLYRCDRILINNRMGIEDVRLFGKLCITMPQENHTKRCATSLFLHRFLSVLIRFRTKWKYASFVFSLCLHLIIIPQNH